MKISILGQGLYGDNRDGVGAHLIRLLQKKEFHSFTAISAFVSEGGVNGLSKYIEPAKKHLTTIRIIVGVDEKVTSQEALEAILALKIRSFVFHEESHVIFHPKIYLFEGKDRSELIIGSSNLTGRGLFANVETSLLISLDLSKKEDLQVVTDLKKYYQGLFDHTDPNLKKLTKKLISELNKEGLLPTEADRQVFRENMKKINASGTSTDKIFPKRATAKIPAEFRPKSKSKIKATPSSPTPAPSGHGKLIWESGPLTERDLNIPHGSNTNPTGSMGFKKGKMQGIDHRHYFRDEAFAHLNWAADLKQPHLERTTAQIHLIINGENKGFHRVALTHNTRTDITTYTQRNSMTHISWGSMKPLIAKPELIGRNASLFQVPGSRDEFILNIE